MFDEFKTFIAKGNVLDMAVGVIVGGAFGKIVSSLVNDILMPPIGRLMGGMDFGGLFINLSGSSYPTLAAAKAAGATTINYGIFLNDVIDFLIVAACVFALVKAINVMRKKEAAAVPTPPRQEALLEEIRDLLKKK